MKDYTIKLGEWSAVSADGTTVGPMCTYELVNPSGRTIALGMSWRTARKIADALNTVRWQS